MASDSQRWTSTDYTIACICPMGVELAPVEGMLDVLHDPLWTKREHNAYTLGSIGGHNIVIAVMPEIGNNAASTTITQLFNDFPAIRYGLLVGIGGGVPSSENADVRLGDVVVGQPTGVFSGVVQYDMGKEVEGGQFQRTGSLNKPPAALSANVRKLESQNRRLGHSLSSYVTEMFEKYPRMKAEYSHPSLAAARDQLFLPTYKHESGPTCDQCDDNQTVPRLLRPDNEPRIHYGTIASANKVIKDAHLRDKIRVDTHALCVEMEAAGLMSDFPCLVVRGICDYADSHKNKKWQPYAAAVAAAYMKALLLTIPGQESSLAVRAIENPSFTTAQDKINEYFLVPRRRVKTFFGREDTLAKIASYFNTETEQPLIMVLCAMGGQGKTQIALEYCQRARRTYRGVFWVNSSSTLTITQSLVGVAHEIEPSAAESLPNDDAKASLAIRALRRWEDRWLMVFDNCDDVAIFSEIGRFIPQGVRGNILITSRHRDLGELGDVIDIPSMPDNAGVALLLHRYHGIDINDHISESTKIVNRLGGLALAIDQASAYMKYIQLPIDELSTFLPLYSAQREKVLQHTEKNFWKYTKISHPDQRQTAVDAFTTWEMSFQQLLDSEEKEDNVAHFLTLSAFFGPTRVNESLFRYHWYYHSPPYKPWPA